MTFSDNGKKLLKEVEGFSLTPYKDSGGLWTVGWGHCTGVYKPENVTMDDCERWFNEDAQEAARAVLRSISVPLAQNEFDALVVFVFNIGSTAFSSSGTLSALNRNDRPDFFLRWAQWNKVTKNGVKVFDQGLLNRRIKEMLLFLGVD